MKTEYRELKLQEKNKFVESGVPEDKLYALEPINRAENRMKKMLNKKKNERFGWDVFNTDSLYRSYKKRLITMPIDRDLYEQQMKDPSKVPEVTEQRKHLLNADIVAQKERQKKFSRRRANYEESDVNYINERNMNFNKKLERFFSKESAEIKANLERGTAL
jgi:pre-mRNA-splicing factor SYF2